MERKIKGGMFPHSIGDRQDNIAISASEEKYLQGIQQRASHLSKCSLELLMLYVEPFGFRTKYKFTATFGGCSHIYVCKLFVGVSNMHAFLMSNGTN